MPVTFKFLGHQFNTIQNCASIPDLKLSAFQELRPPQSIAKAISRLGTISYFSSYKPLLKIVSHPLQKMVTDGTFKWNRIHQMSWDCMKLLCSLKFSNSTIDQTKTLFVCCDSSQIGLGVFCFQLSDTGQMILIWCDSRILKQADRNKSSSFRELLAIL